MTELVFINKKKSKKRESTCRRVDFAIEWILSSSGFCYSGGPQNENLRKLKERQILGPYLGIEKAEECESQGTACCSWCTRNDPQKSEEGIWVIENQ